MTHEVVPLHREARGADLLAGWVRERADAIAHRATEAIWDEVPVYGQRADRTLQPEVEAHCRQVFEAFLASVEDRRHPNRSDFPWTGRHAMRRVDLGIGLPDFMKAFRIGQIALWDDILAGVRERPAAKDAALLLVSQVMRTVEVGSTAAAEAYLEAQQFQLADSARVHRDLLEDLLAGRPPVVRPRRQALEDLGLVDGVPFLLLVASLPLMDEGDRRDQLRMRTALTSGGPGLVVVRQDEVVAILPVEAGADELVLDRTRAAVTSLAGHGVFACAGVSSVKEGYAAVPDAYEEARLARRSLGGEPGVRAVPEMTTLDFLVHAQEGMGRLVRPAVRAFVEEDLAADGVLVGTLSAYVAHDLNAKLAAMRLHVHANTVYYRLERIAERTGCDVRRVEDLIDLLVAVRLVRSERG